MENQAVTGELGLSERIDMLHKEGDLAMAENMPSCLDKALTCYGLITTNINFMLTEEETKLLNQWETAIRKELPAAEAYFVGGDSKKLNFRNGAIRVKTRDMLMTYKKIIMQYEHKYGMLPMGSRKQKLRY